MSDQLYVVLLLIGVLIVGAVLWLVFSMRKDSSGLNKTYYQSKWLEIENSLDKNNLHSYMTAIMSADKLVDDALKKSHFKGSTMGERMKLAQKTWSNSDNIWRAHKIRNRLVHESDFELDRKYALVALSAYKQALKDLGAI